MELIAQGRVSVSSFLRLVPCLKLFLFRPTIVHKILALRPRKTSAGPGCRGHAMRFHSAMLPDSQECQPNDDRQKQLQTCSFSTGCSPESLSEGPFLLEDVNVSHLERDLAGSMLVLESRRILILLAVHERQSWTFDSLHLVPLTGKIIRPHWAHNRHLQMARQPAGLFLCC